MAKVKQLTLNRYEHGLLVRALYEEWHRMLAEEKPTEDMQMLKFCFCTGKNRRCPEI